LSIIRKYENIKAKNHFQSLNISTVELLEILLRTVITIKFKNIKTKKYAGINIPI
jgi:hypothetical protein